MYIYGNGWKYLKRLEITGSLREMAGHGGKCLGMSRNGWKWLDMVMKMTMTMTMAMTMIIKMIIKNQMG